VAFIEHHYVDERGLSPEKTVDFLQQNYLSHGKLGTKCSLGGLYPPAEDKSKASNGVVPKDPKILVLDLGLSTAEPSLNSGQIVELTAEGKIKVLIRNQALPDGIAVDHVNGRMFWTCMGVPGQSDGAVYSANLDGSLVQTVVAPGTINTPKQLTIDSVAQKVYFCDREGLRVFRCKFDGSDLETVIETGCYKEYGQDATKWCVGITVAPTLGKFYWSQKGPSKGGKGRIFGANITMPAGQCASTRDDIQCILDDLPEPVDLEIDDQSRRLYWTDRGEIPCGNSLNMVQLDKLGFAASVNGAQKYRSLSRHFKEAIGLKLDLVNNSIYITDLGGNIYRCGLDGEKKEKLYTDDYRAFTGIALA
jgi:hypothetical protein